ncbi:MAG TPA: outer membrane lipoprotein-sorting protein [Terracidiphilus sp.]|jgi:hypothetical protein|nr:outer membrane lipoprotein-sorting protein [Terracidiphilus sp.]
MKARSMKAAGISASLALLFALLAAAVPPVASDAHAALAQQRQRIESADFETVGHLVRVDANGSRTSYGLSMKAHEFSGTLRVLVQITSPTQAREHILIEMRPGGQSSIEIARPGDHAPAHLPFDAWTDGPLGHGFSYEDFLEQQYFWPRQTLEPEAKFGARDCNVVISVPSPADRTHYAQVKTWLDHTIGFPVYAEKTIKGSDAVKQFTYFGLRHNGGVWSASQMEEKTRGQGGSTLLIIDRGSAKANLRLSDFSSAQLTHF